MMERDASEGVSDQRLRIERRPFGAKVERKIKIYSAPD